MVTLFVPCIGPLSAPRAFASAYSNFCSKPPLFPHRDRVQFAVPLKPHSGVASASDTTTACTQPSDGNPPNQQQNRFVVWGPPGSGKSSICERLSHTHGLVHISTGALLRAHVLYETPFGKLATRFVSSHSPVPDDIVIPVVLERLSQVDCIERGFVLDGFPRNDNQHHELRKAGFDFGLAFMLHAPRDVLEVRIRNRRLDPETNILYNLNLRTTTSPEVFERLVILHKDRGANVSELFAAYARSASDMFHRLSGNVVRIDAGHPFDQVVEDIAKHLENRGITTAPEQLEGHSPVGTPAATPPDSLGRASAVWGRRLGSADFPASAIAAMRTRVLTRNVDMHNSSLSSEEGHTKSPITLIRCDGYMCERESVEGSHITFRGAATEQVMLVWNKPPQSCLLLVKRDPNLMSKVLEAARYLMEEKDLNVIVEPLVQTKAMANGLFLETFSSSQYLHEKVDFVVCLGGDGLILHVSTLFRTAVPPVISFNLGSLGFLTPFQYEDFQAEVDYLMNGNCNLSLRMRLSCATTTNGKVQQEFQVLNEVVVDRGASPYLSNLDCFCDGKYITTVQADGIIMSTPTGSTAYSMSAGGSMVHPSVPAILFTPICPHSLSFRPIVFPDSAKLRIEISQDTRTHAWASFDGKSRQQLGKGDGLCVEMNMFPVPTVNKTDHTGDWFQSLDRAFNFNSRAIQKPLNEDMFAGKPQST